MERNMNAPETFSGSESLEHPSKETKAEGVRRFKANPDFLLREVAGEAVLVPIGEAGVFENSVDLPERDLQFPVEIFSGTQIPGGGNR